MRKLLDYMMNHRHEFVYFNNYSFQIYMDGKNGNIHKPDGTVLVRIFFDDANFEFCFAKKNAPHEYGYNGYFVDKDKELSSLLSISHVDAKELYEVLCGFIG
ncbi:MAG: hypothetical protein PUC30_07155 [Lachnospiraceae bacterium]|nr:hypothetical protein [Lachnospiraceae bacterium]